MKKNKLFYLRIFIFASLLMSITGYSIAEDEIDILMKGIDVKMADHFEVLKKEDYDMAYKDYAFKLQQKISLKDFKGSLSNIFKTTGKLLSFTTIDRYFVMDYESRKTTKAVIVYQAVFKNIEGKIEVNFIEDIDGTIKISRFNVITPPEFKLLEKIDMQ